MKHHDYTHDVDDCSMPVIRRCMRMRKKLPSLRDLCRQRKYDVIRAILDVKPDAFRKVKDGYFADMINDDPDLAIRLIKSIDLKAPWCISQIIRCGNLDVVKAAVTKPWRINSEHFESAIDHPDIFKYLLRIGSASRTEFDIAFRSGNIELAKEVCRYVHPTFCGDVQDIASLGDRGLIAQMPYNPDEICAGAAWGGHLDLLKEYEPSIEGKPDLYGRMLACAASGGHVHVIDYLGDRRDDKCPDKMIMIDLMSMS